MVILLIIVCILLFANETSTLMVCGWYVTDPDIIDLTDYKLNSFDKTIMNSYGYESGNYVAKCIASITCKYYIGGTGAVLRGSELHNKIEAKFKELNSN